MSVPVCNMAGRFGGPQRAEEVINPRGRGGVGGREPPDERSSDPDALQGREILRGAPSRCTVRPSGRSATPVGLVEAWTLLRGAKGTEGLLRDFASRTSGPWEQPSFHLA